MRRGEVKFSFNKDEKRLIRICFKRRKAQSTDEFIRRAESTVAYWLFIRESGPFGEGINKRAFSKVASTIKRLVREIDEFPGKGRDFLEIQANSEGTSIDALLKFKDAIVSLEKTLEEPGIETKPGPKTAEQELLITLLANDYIHVFGKNPSFSENTPFRKFFEILTENLEVNFGQSAFSKARLSWRSRQLPK